MASCTLGVDTYNTTNNAALTSGSFTPAASDLLVLFWGCAGNANVGTVSDSQSLGWTDITSALNNSSADNVSCWVSNSLAANSAMTVTVTPQGSPTSTGNLLSVIRISGITRTGSSAIKQFATQANQSSSTTPAPVFSGNALTGNPTLGALFNIAASGTGVVHPTNWTNASNDGISTPQTSLQAVYRNSGFTSTTITWGGTSSTVFADISLEVDTSALSTGSLFLQTPMTGIGVGGPFFASRI